MAVPKYCIFHPSYLECLLCLREDVAVNFKHALLSLGPSQELGAGGALHGQTLAVGCSLRKEERRWWLEDGFLLYGETCK